MCVCTCFDCVCESGNRGLVNQNRSLWGTEGSTNIKEIYHQRALHLNTLTMLSVSVLLCTVCTYTEHVVRVWSVLGDFLKA